MLQLFICYDIPAGIRGPGHANSGNVIIQMKGTKIYPVLEFMVADFFNFRPPRDKAIWFQRLIHVTDIFWYERKQNFLPALRTSARQQIEEHEKAGLAARSDSNIFGCNVPAVPAVKEIANGGDKGFVALRRIVVAKHREQSVFVSQYVVEGLLKCSGHSRNVGRIAAAEHGQRTIAGQRL